MMKAESTYVLEILNILDKAKRDDYSTKKILEKVTKHLDIFKDKNYPNLDIDNLTSGVRDQEDSDYKKVENIIDKLENEKPQITFDDILEQSQKEKINREILIKNIDRLKQHGVIFEPQKNIFKKLI